MRRTGKETPMTLVKKMRKMEMNLRWAAAWPSRQAESRVKSVEQAATAMTEREEEEEKGAVEVFEFVDKEWVEGLKALNGVGVHCLKFHYISIFARLVSLLTQLYSTIRFT